jgi:uncharacterized protein (TIGR03118 family)
MKGDIVMKWTLGCAIVLVFAVTVAVTDAQYSVTNLVSNGAVPALHTDANLVNPWGLARSTGSFFWVGNNGTGTSTLYDGDGVAQSLVVTVPGVPAGNSGKPTGVVAYAGSNFLVTDGVLSGPARFIFAGEDGSISGWNPNVPASSTVAHTAADNSSRTSIYKGLAFGMDGADERLYAADFHNGAVNVFDSTFGEVTTPGAFQDPTLPAGYAPFNAASINGNVFVTYALQDAGGEDDVPGLGNGFIDIYTPAGTLVSRFASGGVLNSPWGLALAPNDFGDFSGDLLVGNFGDGLIHAYDVNTGTLDGTLSDASNSPLVIDGLWGLSFGNGPHNQPLNTLFFTAGPNDEADGLYGRIDAVPEPAALLLVVLAVAAARRR